MEPIVLKFSAVGLDGISSSILQTVNRMKDMQRALDGINTSMRSFQAMRIDTNISRISSAANAATHSLNKMNRQLGSIQGGSFSFSFGGAKRGGGFQSSGSQSGGGGSSFLKSISNMFGGKGGKGVASAAGNWMKSRGMAMAMAQTVRVGSMATSVGGIMGGLGIGAASAAAAPVAALLALGAFGVQSGQNISAGAGFRLGNSAQGAATAARLGAGLGVDADASSKSFQNAIQSGAARSFATKAGVNPYYNEYTGAGGDFAGKWSKYIAYYGDPTKTSSKTAAAAARATGMEQQIGLAREASSGVRKMLYSKGLEYTEQEKRDAADTTIMTNLAMEEFQKLMNKLGARIMPYVLDVLKKLNVAWDICAKGIEWLEEKTKWMRILAPKEGGAQQEAANTMKDAAKTIQRAADTFSDGVYGQGKARANAAISDGVRSAVRQSSDYAARYYAQQGIPI